MIPVQCSPSWAIKASWDQSCLGWPFMFNGRNTRLKYINSMVINVQQERGLRAVSKDKHASYTQLLERAKLPTVANRRLQDISILMYKVKHRLCPNSICNVFNKHISAYNLRQSDFSSPSYNTVTYGKHSLRYVGPKLWGKLSMADRSAKILQAFTNYICKRDITRLMDTGCKGCILCCT